MDESPVSMRLPCPKCGELHIDEGEFAVKVHHTHTCQACGHNWRPAIVPTYGVRFLPGYKNEVKPIEWKNGVLPYQIRVECAAGDCSNSNAPGVHGWTFRNGEWRCENHSEKLLETADKLFKAYDEHIEMAVKSASGEGALPLGFFFGLRDLRKAVKDLKP